jgi:surface polysaccharide O-acyltransferase-like enzyme
LQGSIGTLWFLPALAMGQFIVGILAHHKKVYIILPIGILLYAFALLGGSYSKYSFGIAEVGIDTRNGPFVSTLFVGIGWLIASTKWWVHTRNKQLVALFLLFFGMLIHMTESYLIYINYYSMFYFDYVVGTVIYSLGVFLLSLTLPNLGRNTLSYIGPLVLGVYLTHQFILNFIKVGRHWLLQYVFTPAGWELFLPVMVLIASVLFTLSLKRIRLTNNLVS